MQCSFGIQWPLLPAIAEAVLWIVFFPLYAAPAAGALVVSLTLGWTNAVRRRRRFQLELQTTCQGFQSWPWFCWTIVACVVLAIAGASDMISSMRIDHLETEIPWLGDLRGLS